MVLAALVLPGRMHAMEVSPGKPSQQSSVPYSLVSVTPPTVPLACEVTADAEGCAESAANFAWHSLVLATGVSGFAAQTFACAGGAIFACVGAVTSGAGAVADALLWVKSAKELAECNKEQ
jgi:hypothetical protein